MSPTTVSERVRSRSRLLAGLSSSPRSSAASSSRGTSPAVHGASCSRTEHLTDEGVTREVVGPEKGSCPVAGANAGGVAHPDGHLLDHDLAHHVQIEDLVIDSGDRTVAEVEMAAPYERAG
jgi:hypothetical protein